MESSIVSSSPVRGLICCGPRQPRSSISIRCSGVSGEVGSCANVLQAARRCASVNSYGDRGFDGSDTKRPSGPLSRPPHLGSVELSSLSPRCMLRGSWMSTRPSSLVRAAYVTMAPTTSKAASAAHPHGPSPTRGAATGTGRERACLIVIVDRIVEDIRIEIETVHESQRIAADAAARIAVVCAVRGQSQAAGSVFEVSGVPEVGIQIAGYPCAASVGIVFVASAHTLPEASTSSRIEPKWSFV